MKTLFDNVSNECSKIVTVSYSTSFSLATKMLHSSIRKDIYNIYGFVRFADEIVDSFHSFDKEVLLDRFESDLFHALEHKISLNPILNSFQQTYHIHNLDLDHVKAFLKSMRWDLHKKNYLSQEDYKEKTTLNKWFFGNGSILDRGYDIPDDVYARMKLTGYNVAHNWPHLQTMQDGKSNRDIDVCAVYQGILDNGNMDHEVRSDVLYTKHRNGAWKELEKIKDKYNIVKGQSSPQQFVEVMKRSKVGLSPFGMGELCYRDLELIQWGCLLIKPDMSKVITEPNFFKPMETYVSVKPDWSDLNETIEKVLANFKDYEYIIHNAKQKVVEMYSYENVCMYWYNFFANMSGVENE